MKMSKVLMVLCGAAAAGLCVSSANAAAFIFNTVGVYDSVANTNAVDRTAIGNVSTFTTAVSTAYSANMGGVVTFDTYGSQSLLPGPITAKYGTSLTKSVDISTDHTFNFQFSPNIAGISGAENGGTGNFLFDPTAGNRFLTFTFGAITGGQVNEKVTQAGLTVLTRNGGGTPTIAVIATYSDNTTQSASLAYTVSTAKNEDTFYGFTAPAGKYITSLQLDYGSSGTDLRRGVDDLAFITSVIPEPTSIGLLGLSTLGLLARRRDRKV